MCILYFNSTVIYVVNDVLMQESQNQLDMSASLEKNAPISAIQWAEFLLTYNKVHHLFTSETEVVTTPCLEIKRTNSILSKTSSNTDRFQNFSTFTISWKFTIKLSLNIPLHLKLVTTLPCEMLMSEN